MTFLNMLMIVTVSLVIPHVQGDYDEKHHKNSQNNWILQDFVVI